jgi:hypothetical protein
MNSTPDNTKLLIACLDLEIDPTENVDEWNYPLYFRMKKNGPYNYNLDYRS